MRAAEDATGAVDRSVTGTSMEASRAGSLAMQDEGGPTLTGD
jgi:hypothetical protein